MGEPPRTDRERLVDYLELAAAYLRTEADVTNQAAIAQADEWPQEDVHPQLSRELLGGSEIAGSVPGGEVLAGHLGEATPRSWLCKRPSSAVHAGMTSPASSRLGSTSKSNRCPPAWTGTTAITATLPRRAVAMLLEPPLDLTLTEATAHAGDAQAGQLPSGRV
ncbi:MAG TPA: hypothetical protein VGI72_11980 [Gaiellales bacterium]